MQIMGQKAAQMEMLLYNPEELIPATHLLKRIDRMISFGFVYDLLKETYSEKAGHPSTLFASSKCCWSVICME